MGETVSLNNPQFVGGDMMQTNEKNRLGFSLVIVGVVILVAGLVFWFVSMDKPIPMYEVSQQDKLRAEVAQLLENAKTQATQAEVSRIADTLSKSKTTATDADRARVASMLEDF